MKISDYYTVSQASDFLGVSKSTIRNWENKGIIKSYRNPFNQYRLFEKRELQRLLDMVTIG